MPRTRILIGVDTSSASISQNPFAYQPKKPKPPLTKQERAIRDRRAKLRKRVYGSTTTERSPTANTRKRNSQLFNLFNSLGERHEGMLTLASCFDLANPAGISMLKDALDRFQRAYTRRYERGWAVVWLEVSDRLMLHAHIVFCTKSGESIEEVEQWAARTWLNNIQRTLKKYGCMRDMASVLAPLKAALVKATPHAVEQLGYAGKGEKKANAQRLLLEAGGLRTWSVWGKANMVMGIRITADLTPRQHEILKRRMAQRVFTEADRLGRSVNHHQVGRALSGDCTTHFMREEELVELAHELGGEVGAKILTAIDAMRAHQVAV